MFVSTILVATIAARVQLRRVPSQNMSDNIDVAQKAMKMVNDNMTELNNLRDRIEQLENELSNGKYKVTFVTRLGEQPEIKSATIERV